MTMSDAKREAGRDLRGRRLWMPDELDRNPWLLNGANGTVDLHTGSLRDHYRDDFITKLCPTDYRPDAPCPTWEGFLPILPGRVARRLSARWCARDEQGRLETGRPGR
jgi:hypothetical protein